MALCERKVLTSLGSGRKSGDDSPLRRSLNARLLRATSPARCLWSRSKGIVLVGALAERFPWTFSRFIMRGYESPLSQSRSSEPCRKGLKQAPKFFWGQASVLGDGAHRERIDWLGSRNNQSPFAVGHNDVAAFSGNVKPEFLEYSNHFLMGDARKFRHARATL